MSDRAFAGGMLCGVVLGVIFVLSVFMVGNKQISHKFIKTNQYKFELDEKVYKIVVDSAATDSLHNWRAK